MQEGNLHKWFKGSKSKDGKSGWVNVVTGGTCASDEPGEGTPKCVSSSKRASMTPAERKSAQSRKKKADPNQQSKSGAAKPTYVSTDKPKKKMKEEAVAEDYKKLPKGKMGMKAGKKFISAVKDTVKGESEPEGTIPQQIGQQKAAKKTRQADKIHNVAGKHNETLSRAKSMKNKLVGMTKKEEYEIEEEDKKGKSSGKKDACYHKVKASASVWPSAYASGRLVQCRKKGAANYGKSKKNEEFMALPEFTDIQIRCMEAAGIEVEVLDEKCWVGYTQKGMKKKGKKVVPNCVPVGEEVEIEEAPQYDKKGLDKFDRSKRMIRHKQDKYGVSTLKQSIMTGANHNIDNEKKAKMKKEEVEIEEATRVPAQNGNVYLVGFTWRGKYMMMKLFFPEVKRPSRNEVKDALEKIYPGCYLQRFDLAPYNPSEPMINVGVSEEVEELEEKSAAWQRKEGKNKEGGLNEKGRKSYERENPGSDLKAPQPEGGPRKKSFCARMGGMKGPMKDEKGRPTRKALALRKWKC